MNQIYYEVLGGTEYKILESEIDGRKSYDLCVDESIIRDVTSLKNKAIEFIEVLIVNAVSPIHSYDVIQDYIA